MVRSNKHPTGVYDLPSMPTVVPALFERYEGILKARLDNFPADEMELIRIPENSEMAPNTFLHQLRYDAESVFWLLLWWCIQAQPAKMATEVLDTEDWGNLTSQKVNRDHTFIRTFPKDCLHSSYSGLVTLLDNMRKHLQGDLDFSSNKEKERKSRIHA